MTKEKHLKIEGILREKSTIFYMCHFVKSVPIWSYTLHISPHLDKIRIDMNYLSVFSPNMEKYGPQKLPVRILFTQFALHH